MVAVVIIPNGRIEQIEHHGCLKPLSFLVVSIKLIYIFHRINLNGQYSRSFHRGSSGFSILPFGMEIWINLFRERPLMTSYIRVGRGVQNSPPKGTLQSRTRQVGKQVKNCQKTRDVINECSHMMSDVLSTHPPKFFLLIKK